MVNKLVIIFFFQKSSGCVTLIKNESFQSFDKPLSSHLTLVAESNYNSMENDHESDISNEIIIQEKDSGTDMVYSGEDLPTSSKALRGRKKPTYISPYRQQKSKNRISSNKINAKTQATLTRQSTFTKDEPTNDDVPVVDMPNRIKSSTNEICAKSEEKSIVKKTKQYVSSIPKMCGPQRSNSTATIRVSPSINLNRNNIPLTQPPSRSNSTLTKVNSNKLNQIGSKISGIWKNKSNVQISDSNTNNKNKESFNDKKIIPHKESDRSILKVTRNSYQTSSAKYFKK